MALIEEASEFPHLHEQEENELGTFITAVRVDQESLSAKSEARFPCVSRYALLARGSAFRLYAASFCVNLPPLCTAMDFFFHLLLVQT